MTSSPSPVPSTAIVLYDPALPHISLKSYLEKATDAAFRRSLDALIANQQRLSSDHGTNPLSEIPLTPPQEALAAFFSWLNAYNNENFESLGLSDDKITSLQGWFSETKELSLIKFEEIDQKHVVAIVKERCSDKFLRIELKIDKVIKDVRLSYIEESEGFKTPRYEDDVELTQEVQEYLGHLEESGYFTGSAIIAKQGVPILVSNPSERVEPKYNIASIGKMFTAVGILQLAEKREINLDDYLGQYLPNYPNEMMRNVTIRQLLNHTAGAGDIFGPQFTPAIEASHDPKDYIKIYGERKPSFEPGTQWEYSNYGYILLGAIIEAVSGQRYDQYVQDNIFTPAYMTSSGSYWNDQIENRMIGMTRGYGRKGLRKDAPLESSDIAIPACNNTAAGGGYSTASDLLKFSNALQDGRLVGITYARMLMRNSLSPETDTNWALGCDVDSEGRWFGHAGSEDGFSSVLRIYPDSGYTVIVLAALDSPRADRVTDWIDARLPIENSET